VDTPLIVTNRGLCAGGDVGYENYRWHFALDGCIFSGTGGVAATGATGVDYRQANVPAYGFKFGPGASMIVSSSRSRIGVRLPMIFNFQRLTNPGVAGYNIEAERAYSLTTTLFSRWQLGKWHVQTEFGKYIQREATIWALGFGKTF
jgi:hypothetical protein